MGTDSSQSGPLSVEVAERQASAAAGGAAGAPLLDKGDRNVPRDSKWGSWTRKQWRTRRAILDRLRSWQGNGYQCLWVTLTSSPQSPPERLRKDWQALRKRVFRELGFLGFEYVCVETREGHGVLHMIWAWRDPDRGKRASFFVPFEWLQRAWQEIHGAFHVNIKRVGVRSRDARRLSRYMVAQYCGGQNALVRVSQSRMELPLTGLREQLLRLMRGMPERYEFGNVLSNSLSGDEFTSAFNSFFWSHFRSAWESLLAFRSCEAYGVQLAIVDRRIVRI